MDSSIFEEGFKLMAFGMGNVFLFLILMVVIITIASKLLTPYAHLLEEPVKPKRKGAKKKSTLPKSEDDNAIISAITSAVHQFRQDKK